MERKSFEDIGFKINLDLATYNLHMDWLQWDIDMADAPHELRNLAKYLNEIAAWLDSMPYPFYPSAHALQYVELLQELPGDDKWTDAQLESWIARMAETARDTIRTKELSDSEELHRLMSQVSHMCARINLDGSPKVTETVTEVSSPIPDIVIPITETQEVHTDPESEIVTECSTIVRGRPTDAGVNKHEDSNDD